jgi:hypothetical protein
MRIATLGIIGVLTVGVVLPAAAQRAYVPTHNVCHRMAVNNSLTPGQHGYIEFMRECTTGRVGTYQSPR